jgi:hypothetical protein
MQMKGKFMNKQCEMASHTVGWLSQLPCSWRSTGELGAALIMDACGATNIVAADLCT